MKEITITMDRYDELVAKEYAYEVFKLAAEENNVWLRDFAKLLFHAKPKKDESTDEF